jgi:hypothetical protein
MPAKIKEKQTTPFSSIRERFQGNDANVRAHHDLVDSPAFDRGADAALADFTAEVALNIVDMNSAAAAGYRIRGAVDFLRRFKTFAEVPPPQQPQALPGALIPTDPPRRP